MNPLDNSQLKEETLRWIFSILSAVLVYVFAANVVITIYHPDVDLLKRVANDILIEPATVRPEPLEALLFRLGVIIIIPGIAGFYFLLSKIKLVNILAKKPFYFILSALCLAFIVALTYFDFAALNPFGPLGDDQPQNKRDTIADTNFSFYFDDIFLGNYFGLYALILVPLIGCLFFIGFKKYNWEKKKVFKIVTSVIGYAVCGWAVAVIMIMNTVKFPYTAENKFDFAAVYYSMTQVYAGMPMLVNHFTNTYGLYPHFLDPVFKITGLNILKFSLVLSILTGLSFFLNFYVLKKLVGNKVILFLGFASVIFFPYLDFKLLTIFDCIFSYYPIRYLGPSVLIWLTVLYVTKPSGIKYWATFVVAALFILWNPEIGMVGYLSWLMVNIYRDFYTDKGKIATKKILYHLVAGVVILFSVFYTYKLLIYIVYGVWPDLSLLFGTIFIFSKIGFNLLPMSLVHPWNLMALVLVLGFTYSIIKWYKKAITPKSCIVLLVSLIALGYFVYFQGRSHNSNLALSSGFCLILLTILGDELWMMTRNKNVFLLNGLFIIFLFFISFSIVEIIFNTKKMMELVYQEDDKKGQVDEQKTIENNADFISRNSEEHEKIIVLVPKKHQALYFDGSKRVSGFNPGFIEMFLKTDLTRLENIISDSSFNIYAELGSHIYTFMARQIAAIAASYEYRSVIPTMVRFSKRKTKIPANIFFNDTNQLVLHRKYSDDTGGRKLRINDAMGVTTVPLGQQFSVEVLFYPVTQVYPRAMLVGNVEIKDTVVKGFAIGNVLNSSKYYFMINGAGFFIALKDEQWAYCEMNVYPERIEIYINGILSYEHSLQKPISKSKEKIGVSCFDYPYVGAIAEVAIANKVLDSNQIDATWKKIKQAVNQ